MDDYFFVILGASLLGGALFGYLVGRFGPRWLFHLCWGLMVAGSIAFTSESVMGLMGLPDGPMDRLPYFALILLFAAPGLLGFLCVGIPMLLRRRKDQDTTE